MRLTSPLPLPSDLIPPQAIARPSSYTTRNFPRGASYSDAIVSTRPGSRTIPRTSNSLAYESSSSAAVGSVVATVRTSSAAAATSVAIPVLAAVEDAASDVDHPGGAGTRVKERALALADLQRTAVQRRNPQRRRARRLVLRDAGGAREDTRAEQARRLVDPRPAVDEAERVRRIVEA